jgi:hypothetical protein
MKFGLKRCCDNCPFLKGTSMVLEPGRMEGIVEHIQNDLNVFPCHKTTHALRRDDDEEDEAGSYDWHGREQACLGALAFNFQQHGRLPVLARLALMSGDLKLETLEAQAATLAEPDEWETTP